jgi:hypothetical protein
MFRPTIDTRNVGYFAPNQRQSGHTDDIDQKPATQEPQHAAGLASNQKCRFVQPNTNEQFEVFGGVLHVTRVSLNRGAFGVLGTGM